MAEHRKPTRDELGAAAGRRSVRDVLSPGLTILFVGINPGLYSGATGYPFAKPGNRFWPALHKSGFTPRQFHPSEAPALVGLGIGMSKLVHRATATAAELSGAELRRGGARVRRTVRKLRPRAVVFLGIGAYEQAYGVKRVQIGRQGAEVEGKWGGAQVWVLPNPSGLNANHQMPDFVRMFRAVRRALRHTE